MGSSAPVSAPALTFSELILNPPGRRPSYRRPRKIGCALLVADRRLQTDLMIRRYPRFAAIPFGGRKGRTMRPLRGGTRPRSSGFSWGGAARGLPRVGSWRALRGLMTGDSGRLWFLPRIVHLMDLATVCAHGRKGRRPGAARYASRPSQGGSSAIVLERQPDDAAPPRSHPRASAVWHVRSRGDR